MSSPCPSPGEIYKQTQKECLRFSSYLPEKQRIQLSHLNIRLFQSSPFASALPFVHCVEPQLKSRSVVVPPDQSSSAYSLYDSPTQGEESPYDSQDQQTVYLRAQKSLAFHELHPLLLDSSLVSIDRKPPQRVNYREFTKPNKNGQRYLLIQHLNPMVTSLKMVESYLREVFYEISNIKREDYRFYVSKASFVYYQGVYSLLVKFCDQSALQFFSFSFEQHRQRHQQFLGPQFQSLKISQLVTRPSHDWFAVIFRNLPLNFR